MSEIIRVLIADDHTVVRQGIRIMLEPKHDFIVVGEAVNGVDAVALCKTLEPDILILDLVMPIMDGLETIQMITKANLRTHILVLTSFSEEDKVIRALKAGAKGFILKDSSPKELIDAIRQVNNGELWLPSEIVYRVLSALLHPDIKAPAEIDLTSREIEVLKLVSKGSTNREIATTLSISEGTVRFHMNHILAKLNLSNRTQAALYALRIGLSTLDNSN